MKATATCLSLVIHALLTVSVHGVTVQSQAYVKVPHDEDVLHCSPTLPMPPFDWKRGNLGEHCGCPMRAIVDIGGNIGDDVASFLEWHENVTVFTNEPIPGHFKKMQDRFRNNPRVNLTNAGVSDANFNTEFIVEGKNGEGTSSLDHTIQGEIVKAHLQDVDDVLTRATQTLGFVPDAVNINCEGCEYAVMQRIVDKGWLGKIPYIQLSWHTPAGVEDREAKRCKIEQALLQSYDRVYQSYPGWVAWKLRGWK